MIGLLFRRSRLFLWQRQDVTSKNPVIFQRWDTHPTPEMARDRRVSSNRPLAPHLVHGESPSALNVKLDPMVEAFDPRRMFLRSRPGNFYPSDDETVPLHDKWRPIAARQYQIMYTPVKDYRLGKFLRLQVIRISPSDRRWKRNHISLKPIEILGYYWPIPIFNEAEAAHGSSKDINNQPYRRSFLKFDRVKYWLGKGAYVSSVVRDNLVSAGLCPAYPHAIPPPSMQPHLSAHRNPLWTAPSTFAGFAEDLVRRHRAARRHAARQRAAFTSAASSNATGIVADVEAAAAKRLVVTGDGVLDTDATLMSIALDLGASTPAPRGGDLCPPPDAVPICPPSYGFERKTKPYYALPNTDPQLYAREAPRTPAELVPQEEADFPSSTYVFDALDCTIPRGETVIGAGTDERGGRVPERVQRYSSRHTIYAGKSGAF